LNWALAGLVASSHEFSISCELSKGRLIVVLLSSFVLLVLVVDLDLWCQIITSGHGPHIASFLSVTGGAPQSLMPNNEKRATTATTNKNENDTRTFSSLSHIMFASTELETMPLS
jgi:hypothetical protein